MDPNYVTSKNTSKWLMYINTKVKYVKPTEVLG